MPMSSNFSMESYLSNPIYLILLLFLQIIVYDTARFTSQFSYLTSELFMIELNGLEGFKPVQY